MIPPVHLAGFNKLTLLDYPGKMAAILFLQGCNMHCPFCHNAPLIPENADPNNPSLESALAYLDQRQGLLDGVVISGGEPCLQHIFPLMSQIKSMGYDIKLDTNGTRPDIIRQCLDENFIDYIAMDIKSDTEHYPEACGLINPPLDKIHETIDLITSRNISHEFRTTVTPSLHTPEIILNLCLEFIPSSSAYWIQGFQLRDTVPNQSLQTPDAQFLQSCANTARTIIPDTHIRNR